MKGWLYSLVLVLAATTAAWAVEPDELLDDPVLESRARELSKQLRCVVCQNQDIDSSNAGVARTMRTLLRERLIAGETDDEIIAFFVDRYGDFVLFKPRLKPATYLLWFGPAVLLAVGISVVFVTIRRRSRAVLDGTADPLSPDEEREFEAIFKENEGRRGP